MSKITKKQLQRKLERQETRIDRLVGMLAKKGFYDKLKQLDQSVFDGLDEKWRFAAVDSKGGAFLFSEKPSFSKLCVGFWFAAGAFGCKSMGYGYDPANWQDSLIESNVAKELTGSDLCHEMLKRGDKAVMCKINESNSMTIIIGYKESRLGGWVFQSHRHPNHYIVTPINNQGEPLTAAEAGL